MSFIVAFPFQPRSVSKLEDYLFGNTSILTDEGGDEIKVEEIAIELFQKLSRQQPNNQALINKQLDGWLIVPYDEILQKYDYKSALNSETVSSEEAVEIYRNLKKPEKYIYVFIFDSSVSVLQALVSNSIFKDLEHRLVINY